MSWASSWLPSTNHRVLTSSSRRSLNVRSSRSAQAAGRSGMGAGDGGRGCGFRPNFRRESTANSGSTSVFGRAYTLLAGLLIPSPSMTRTRECWIAAAGKKDEIPRPRASCLRGDLIQTDGRAWGEQGLSRPSPKRRGAGIDSPLPCRRGEGAFKDTFPATVKFAGELRAEKMERERSATEKSTRLGILPPDLEEPSHVAPTPTSSSRPHRRDESCGSRAPPGWPIAPTTTTL